MNIDDLPELDLLSEAFQNDPEAVVAPLREAGGVAKSFRGVEILTYEGCTELFRDKRFWAGAEDKISMTGISEGPVFETMVHLLPNTEGDAHRRQRKAAAGWFTNKRAEEWRSEVRSWVNDWIDAHLEAGEIEFEEVVGRVLPATLFCRMLGVPLADAPMIGQLSHDLLLLVTFEPQHAETIRTAHTEASAYVEDLIERRRKEPGDDLLSAMLEAEGRGEVTARDVLDVTFTILMGSTDTTNAQLCLNLSTLAANPDQWQLLKSDEAHVATAPNELLRFNPGMITTARVAREDLVFRDIEVPAGMTLWGDIFSANRDPAAWDDPNTLDITKRSKRPALNFGSGHHACIGRIISLMEQQETLRVVAQRWKSFDVVNEEFIGQPHTLAPRRLTVRFEAEEHAPA